ncbi:uncharacterized protein [Cherax quadricarinatus]|uniref:uncharacterized protein isoform X2 n=1 Tax=Cherax quadricarinatus TaxID=27406 RepID=UPI00387EC7B5
MCSLRTVLLLIVAAASTGAAAVDAGAAAVDAGAAPAAAVAAAAEVTDINITGVVTAPRMLLEGEKLYLSCQVDGDFNICGWDSPLEEIIYPEDLTDPDADIIHFPGFNCGIIVKEVMVAHTGHWSCIATTDQGFAAVGEDIIVRVRESWPGVVTNISSPLFGKWGEWGEVQLCPPNSFADSLELKSEAPITGDNTAANGLLLPCRQQGGDLPATITSTVADFGTWRDPVSCPVPEYIHKFQLRVETEDAFDDTAVNDIRFTCTNNPEVVMSGGGESWGVWGDWASCPNDTAVCGIQTKVEPYMGLAVDDTSLNDVRFFCCPTVW